VTQSKLGYQVFEALTMLSIGGGQTEVGVDELDIVRMPA
jgi:hypothetical protein